MACARPLPHPRRRAARKEKGVGFDAARGDIDMVARVREWEKAGDQRMWRVIVSPEDADRIDLKEHVRSLVREMETDLATRLEWVAIDHNNTDNPHAHLLLRGVDDRGKSLMIDREYVTPTSVHAVDGIASRALGNNGFEPEMLRARGETISKERWTEIDRALQRRAIRNGSSITLVSFHTTRQQKCGPSRKCGGSNSWKGWGWPRRLDTHAWELSPDHERDLRSLQIANDVIKRQAEANKVRSLNELADERDVVMANSSTRGGYQGRFVGTSRTPMAAATRAWSEAIG